jgi:hypothetical protein
MSSITKDHAKAIAKKLRATIDTSTSAHDAAKVYDDNGRLVGIFGIRRGSKSLSEKGVRS